jgi:hypothetical protein
MWLTQYFAQLQPIAIIAYSLRGLNFQKGFKVVWAKSADVEIFSLTPQHSGMRHKASQRQISPSNDPTHQCCISGKTLRNVALTNKELAASKACFCNVNA